MEAPPPPSAWSEAKRVANEAYSASRWQDAVDAYTRCLGEDELPVSDRVIILSNRAAALLKLNRFADAIEDCTSALTLSSDGNAKALYRR